MLRALLKVKDYKPGINITLLVFRILIAALMLSHGIPKLEKIMAGNFNFSDPLGIGSELSLILVVFAEFFCSILIAIGLATRLAVIPLIFTMLVIIFLVHGFDTITSHYNVLLYLLGYIVLFVTGGGRYSVDYYLKIWKNKTR